MGLEHLGADPMTKSRTGRRPRGNREDLGRIRHDQRRLFKASVATRASAGSWWSEAAMLQRLEDAESRVHGSSRGMKVCVVHGSE
jgi:hypothetical protein